MKTITRLAHGTTFDVGIKSIKSGLIPRGNKESLWDCPSSDKAVYLSISYALHYAIYAADVMKSKTAALVEIDPDLLQEPAKLMPDEDALEQAYRITRGEFFPADLDDMSVKDRTVWYSQNLELARQIGYDHVWSLRVLGNCCYEGTIPQEAITRVVAIKNLKKLWWLKFFDPVISVANFKYMGDIYSTSQLVLLGRLEEAHEVAGVENVHIVDWLDELVTPNIEVMSIR